jgi:hypothetical protein
MSPFPRQGTPPPPSPFFQKTGKKKKKKSEKFKFQFFFCVLLLCCTSESSMEGHRRASKKEQGKDKEKEKGKAKSGTKTRSSLGAESRRNSERRRGMDAIIKSREARDKEKRRKDRDKERERVKEKQRKEQREKRTEKREIKKDDRFETRVMLRNTVRLESLVDELYAAEDAYLSATMPNKRPRIFEELLEAEKTAAKKIRPLCNQDTGNPSTFYRDSGLLYHADRVLRCSHATLPEDSTLFPSFTALRKERETEREGMLIKDTLFMVQEEEGEQAAVKYTTVPQSEDDFTFTFTDIAVPIAPLPSLPLDKESNSTPSVFSLGFGLSPFPRLLPPPAATGGGAAAASRVRVNGLPRATAAVAGGGGGVEEFLSLNTMAVACDKVRRRLSAPLHRSKAPAISKAFVRTLLERNVKKEEEHEEKTALGQLPPPPPAAEVTKEQTEAENQSGT